MSAPPSVRARRWALAASAARWRHCVLIALLLGGIGSLTPAATWRWAHPQPAAVHTTEVLWTGERFVAFGPDLVLESPDGRDWAELGDGAFPPVCFANVLEPVTDALRYRDRIVAVTEHTLQSSPDGVTWTDHVDFVGQWMCTHFGAVAANGSTVVAVGYNCWSVGGAPMAYYSENGTDWSAAVLPPQNPDPFTSEELSDVAWDGRQFIAVGNGWPGGLVLFTSPDGREWTRTTGVGGSVISHGGGVTVILGFQSRVWSSTGGEHWSESALPGDAGAIFDAVWVRDRFVAVSPKGVLTSPDGVAWRFQPLAAEAKLTRVATDGTGVVLAGRDFYFGDDGEHWTPWVTQRLTADDLRDVAVGMWRAVAVGAGGTVLTSTDGESWTVAATVGGAHHVVYGGGRWLALSECCRALWSSDGFLWHPEPGLSGPVVDLAWGAGVFIAVSRGSPFVSADGVVWVPADLPAGYSISTVTWTGTEFATIAETYAGPDAVLHSRDGRTWRSTAPPQEYCLPHRVVGAAGREFVVCGGWQYLYASADGETWEHVPTDWPILDLDTVGGRLLATTARDAGYGDEVWVSSDGASWERIGPVPPGIKAFAALGDRLIAVGDNGAIRYVGEASLRPPRRRLTGAGPD